MMPWNHADGTVEIDHSEEDAIRSLLVGRSVRKVDAGRLVLDDGTELVVEANTGGCSCGAGDYDLTELNGCENIITSVEFECEDRGYGEDWDQQPTIYRLFVFAEHQKLKLLQAEGDDGNGYYGTGWHIKVRPSPNDAPSRP